jgi:NitT/TauT family transport system substrate-binding protein
MAEKPEIKIGHLPITDHLILGVTHYKLLKGMETFEHCTIKPLKMSGWDYIGDGLRSDELDAAFILAPYGMELFHGGEKLKLVLLGHKTGSILVTNSKLNIQKIEDFKGKRVLVPFHISLHFMLLCQLLDEAGLEVGMGKDVEFDIVAPSEMPQYFSWDEKGELAGYIVAEPFGSVSIKEGLGKEFKLSKDIWPNHPCCVFVVKDEIIEKYPEAIQEICTSFVKSGMITEKKPKEVAKIGKVFLNQDEELIEKVLTTPPDRVKTGELMPIIEDFEKMQNYMTDKINVMSGKIDLEKFIITDFAKGAGAQ